MPFSEAETIRAYLDEHEGETRVPFHNLLTTWGLEQAGEPEREGIERELAEAGVTVEPELSALDRDDEVMLRVAAQEPEEPALEELEEPSEAREHPPPVPWQAELEAAGRRTPGGARFRLVRRRPLRIRNLRRNILPMLLVLMSGGAAAALGYLLGKVF